jgi:hypothetical protein
MYIAQQEFLRDFYQSVVDGRLKPEDPAKMDTMRNEALADWTKKNVDQKSGSPYTSGDVLSVGRYDVCNLEIGSFIDMCTQGVTPTLCNWLNESIRTPEGQHQKDANDPEQQIDRRYYCRSNTNDAARIAAQREVNAYNAELKILNEKLKNLEKDCRSGGDAVGSVRGSVTGDKATGGSDSLRVSDVRTNSCTMQVIKPLLGRYYLIVNFSGDANPGDNMMCITFVPHDTLSPLEGTDWPSLTGIPILMRVLDIPMIPDVESRIAAALGDLMDKIPYLKDVEDYRRLIQQWK